MVKEHNEGGPLMDRIRADVTMAKDLGLFYTPLVYVNGREMRAFQTPGALTRMVLALAEHNPPFGSPLYDSPPKAAEKYVDDWQASAQIGKLGADRFVAMRGNPDAKVKIQVWYDYASPFSKKMETQVQEILAQRNDVSVTVRHFPTENECVPQIKEDVNEYSCERAKIVEAVGRIGGVDAYFKVHDWLFANQDTYTREALANYIGSIGIDFSLVEGLIVDPEVISAILEDVDFLYQRKLASIPRMFVNTKSVPRWDLEGADVIRAIVERAADAP